jgi:endoglucanase
MVADCFRLANNPDLQKKYTEEAIKAYKWAGNQKDKMLDVSVSGLRGTDLEMTAAAFLYNLTGDKRYETVIAAESEVKNAESKIKNMGMWEQQYASLAYILTPQKVTHPDLLSNMKKAFIAQAKSDYVDKMEKSPTKAARWSGAWEGMMQTSNEMSLVAIAHKLTESEAEKTYFEKGMYAEAEWTLGRNPLGLVQMTGLSDRCITQAFAPGRRDGYSGLTPGWTPYMCRDGWMRGDDNIIACDWYTSRNYPADKEVWPWGENFWNTRYCVPGGETTPQQTIRQKIVLYGYLYAIANKYH